MNEKKIGKISLRGISQRHKRLIILFCAILTVVLVIGSGVYCIATDQSPASALSSVFTSNKKEICAKWQNQERPGLSAYVFYEDGTYDSYLSSYNFDGEYTIKRNKITLVNPTTKKELVYDFSIHGDVLTLTLIKEDGEKLDEPEVSKFDKVDELNMKNLSDIISDIKDSKKTAE